MSEESLFERLSKINVSKWVEKKNGLTYLSWAHAWREFKLKAPDATYKIAKSDTGSMCFRCGTGLSVHTEVTACGESHEMWLPVMDYKNQGIPADKVTSFEVNKTVMRCLVKNLAMFGLGIYIYAGEDLPEAPEAPPATPKPLAKLANEGVTKWEDWKHARNPTFGEIVASSELSNEDKEKMLTEARDFLRKQADKVEDNNLAEYCIKGEQFAKQALTALESRPF